MVDSIWQVGNTTLNLPGGVQAMTANITVPSVVQLPAPTTNLYYWIGLSTPSLLLMQPILNLSTISGVWSLFTEFGAGTTSQQDTNSVNIASGSTVTAEITWTPTGGGLGTITGGWVGFPSTFLNIANQPPLTIAQTAFEIHTSSGQPTNVDLWPPTFEFEGVTLQKVVGVSWISTDWVPGTGFPPNLTTITVPQQNVPYPATNPFGLYSNILYTNNRGSAVAPAIPAPITAPISVSTPPGTPTPIPPTSTTTGPSGSGGSPVTAPTNSAGPTSTPPANQNTSYAAAYNTFTAAFNAFYNSSFDFGGAQIAGYASLASIGVTTPAQLVTLPGGPGTPGIQNAALLDGGTFVTAQDIVFDAANTAVSEGLNRAELFNLQVTNLTAASISPMSAAVTILAVDPTGATLTTVTENVAWQALCNGYGLPAPGNETA